uniref:Uncharacterized protein n=1 Tax=Anguilla anguilla TaxID=7936 RepID=A0A0E9UUF0_ANGAN
MFITSDLGF